MIPRNLSLTCHPSSRVEFLPAHRKPQVWCPSLQNLVWPMTILNSWPSSLHLPGCARHALPHPADAIWRSTPDFMHFRQAPHQLNHSPILELSFYLTNSHVMSRISKWMWKKKKRNSEWKDRSLSLEAHRFLGRKTIITTVPFKHTFNLDKTFWDLLPRLVPPET